MRYICMHKTTPSTERFERPSPALLSGMGGLIGEVAKDGRLLGGGGLLPSDRRHRLRRDSDRWVVQRGARPGGNSLPAWLVLIEVPTLEDGLRWAERYGRACGVDEVELGPTTEAWHLGLAEEPPDAPLHFMILAMATAATESGGAPSAAERAAVAALEAEMSAASVLQLAIRLLPSRHAARLQFRGQGRTITDGPFAESKELISGFVLLQVRSFDEMLAFADRYGRILDEDVQLDLRQAEEPR